MKKVILLLLVALIAIPASVLASEAEEEKEALIWVWYPNESVPEREPARQALVELVSEAIGRPIEEQLTTDYNIAIEALVNDNAAFSFLGGEGYTQAHNSNPAIMPMVVNSGQSGTLADAGYYMQIGTLAENASEYQTNGEWDLDKLEQKSFSFVSNSSTSGFRFPSTVIANNFGVESTDLLEGGDDKVFAEVQFGGSHQGAFQNVLSGRTEVGTFCNVCINYLIDNVNGDQMSPEPGDILRVLDDAEPPFDRFAGEEVVLIATTLVPNAPLVWNTNLLTQEEMDAIHEAFLSDEVANDPRLFSDDDLLTFFADGERFLTVEDSFYDIVRRMSGLL